ncbi:MAG: AsmA-like C-terminal region-containing protein [Acidobacteriota bacterium]|nr:AsmA-like C-terminal region-containing protein [Acidobacteriota bacterium]
MSRRLKLASGGLILAIAAAAGVLVALRGLEPRLHRSVTGALSEALESDVTLGRVSLAPFPLRLTARDLVIRHHGRTDIPPLIVVQSFVVDLKPMDLWSSTVEHVRVDGMEVHIPPKDETGKRPLPKAGDGGGGEGPPLVVRRFTATNTRLAIIPRTKDKNPKVWDIYELEMDDLGAEAPARFRAALTNPIPYGTIESAGRFGPWDAAEPGASALEGEYAFAADLGTIKGLRGHLDASGSMGGTLEQIVTRGETRTPDFTLTALEGASLPLTTTYDALVDGTKGDVELKRVDIMLGNSPLQARGVIEGTHGLRGKRVVLNVTATAVNLAELLQLTSKAKPPMARGTVSVDAAFDLPQGDADVMDRLELEGSFKAERLRFADAGVQDKIDTLSRRGQGRPTDESIDNVASNVTSKFALRKRALTYRGLAFTVQGASIKLDGTHRLGSRTLALEGEVLLKASASNTLTGFKRWMVKPFDSLLRKNGAGTRLVIRVEGTQDEPKVGLELGKTLRGQ